MNKNLLTLGISRDTWRSLGRMMDSSVYIRLRRLYPFTSYLGCLPTQDWQARTLGSSFILGMLRKVPHGHLPQSSCRAFCSSLVPPCLFIRLGVLWRSDKGCSGFPREKNGSDKPHTRCCLSRGLLRQEPAQQSWHIGARVLFGVVSLQEWNKKDNLHLGFKTLLSSRHLSMSEHLWRLVKESHDH